MMDVIADRAVHQGELGKPHVTGHRRQRPLLPHDFVGRAGLARGLAPVGPRRPVLEVRDQGCGCVAHAGRELSHDLGHAALGAPLRPRRGAGPYRRRVDEAPSDRDGRVDQGAILAGRQRRRAPRLAIEAHAQRQARASVVAVARRQVPVDRVDGVLDRAHRGPVAVPAPVKGAHRWVERLALVEHDAAADDEIVGSKRVQDRLDPGRRGAAVGVGGDQHRGVVAEQLCALVHRRLAGGAGVGEVRCEPALDDAQVERTPARQGPPARHERAAVVAVVDAQGDPQRPFDGLAGQGVEQNRQAIGFVAGRDAHADAAHQSAPRSEGSAARPCPGGRARRARSPQRSR